MSTATTLTSALRPTKASVLVLMMSALTIAASCSDSDADSRRRGDTNANGSMDAEGINGSGGHQDASGGDDNLDSGILPPLEDDIPPGNGNARPGPWALPAGYTESLYGGFLLGPAIEDVDDPQLPDDAPGADGAGCGTTIIGMVRDFRDDHPDFENYCCGLFEGLVEGVIGPDQKPVYAHPGGTSMSTGPDEFNQWYNTIESINLPYWIYINLQPNAGVYTFHSDAFFPLDGEGWGNEGREHNFHFTTEIHTKFRYRGGEVFRFTGDDDIFVFINGQLVIDLGGVHEAVTAEVVLDDVADEIGLVVDNQYNLDLFQAERRTVESNFRIDTTLELVDCGYVPPVVR